MKHDSLIWLLGFLAILIFLIALGGCSTYAARLLAKQYAIQDCILSGGHARLGPGDTILCDFGDVP